MRKVTYPTCLCCGTKTPEYESTRFNFRVCYLCLRRLVNRFVAMNCIDSNPLTEELFDGVWGTESGGVRPDENHYSVWYTSGLHSSAQRLVKRVKKEM